MLAHSSGTVSSGTDVVFEVRFSFRDAVHTMRVSAPRNLSDVKPVVVQNVSNTVLGAKPRSFDSFILQTLEGKEIVQAATILPGEQLLFFAPEILEPVSASSWTKSLLQQLKVRTDYLPINDFLMQFKINDAEDLPDNAVLLLNTLKSLTHEAVSTFRDASKHALLRSDNPEADLFKMSMVKFLYMIEKYPNLEAVVDSFVLRLLIALGYEEDMLVAVQQFRLKLPWGVTEKESIADFTIMDVLSFLKIFIIEDKNLDSVRLDSTPQVFGEAVAVNATNRLIRAQEPARKKAATGDFMQPTVSSPSAEPSGPLLGVRVNGTRFFFYSIIIPERIETAMECRTPPHRGDSHVWSGRRDRI